MRDETDEPSRQRRARPCDRDEIRQRRLSDPGIARAPPPRICSGVNDQGPRTVRDPLWNTIRIDPTSARIIDTAAFQRLRYIRQLGLAHLVYPGATHTRFDHAL